MAVKTEWEDDGAGVILAFSGVVDGPELIGALSRLVAEFDLTKLRYQSWDFTDVVEFNISTAQMRELGAISAQSMKQGMQKRFIAVTAPQDHVYGQVRQWTVFAGEQDGRPASFEIFRDRGAADAWTDERMTETYGPNAAPFKNPE